VSTEWTKFPEGIVLTTVSAECTGGQHEKCAQVFDVPEDEIPTPVAGTFIAWGGRKRMCKCFCHLADVSEAPQNWN